MVIRAKSFSRGFAARGFGLWLKMYQPKADIENSRRTREKPLLPRVNKVRQEKHSLILILISISYKSEGGGA